jgi:ribosome-binding factor A
MTTHSRPARVGQMIQRELAEVLTRGLKDPRIGFVTITGVDMSTDLRDATVFFSTYGDAAALEETKKGLLAARGFLRKQIASALQMRFTPELHFKYDATVATGDRIDQLLKQVQPSPAPDLPKDPKDGK